jgi:hypothetical protein
MALQRGARHVAILKGPIGSGLGLRAGLRASGGYGIASGMLVEGRRYKSGPYGYTQAKALVYSKYGEPTDVLSYVLYCPGEVLEERQMLTPRY